MSLRGYGREVRPGADFQLQHPLPGVVDRKLWRPDPTEGHLDQW